MDLYPAIDIRAGRCVRLLQGDFDQETVYNDDPVAVARSYEEAGARWVHVVDLDAARRVGSNRPVIEQIANSVGLSIQVGGGVRDESLLKCGVARIVVGSMATEDPDATQVLCVEHPGQVAIGVDHRGGLVQTRGWEQSSDVTVAALVTSYSAAAAFIVTDISRDGTLAGPDIEGLRQVTALTEVPVIASGGVGGPADLIALKAAGVAGVIVGKALYEGTVSLREGLALCAP